MIGIVKKCIVSTLENRTCSFNELLTVFAEAALIVNSRPIGVAGRVEDTEAGMAVTPLHLMLGRATAEAPRIRLEEPVTTERHLRFLEELRRSFWRKWRAVVFQGLDWSAKWRHEQRDFRKGDVVLIKSETAAAATYRLALIECAYPSLSDNKVRKVFCKIQKSRGRGIQVF